MPVACSGHFRTEVIKCENSRNRDHDETQFARSDWTWVWVYPWVELGWVGSVFAGVLKTWFVWIGLRAVMIFFQKISSKNTFRTALKHTD